MSKTKFMTFIIALAIFHALMCTGVYADKKPVFEIGQITADAGTGVKVPLTLSNNMSGICGATLTVSYDSRLTLVDVKKDKALSSLAMTPPGDMNDNPVNIVWDGTEADTSNGTIAYLTFTAPNTSGTYPITLSCVDGDVLDGDINPVDVTVISGCITVVGGTPGTEPQTKTTVRADTVAVATGGEVEVPILISDNTGICGVTLTVSYDKRLTLTAVKQGKALSSLAMTKPGDMNDNPVNIVWDGTEEDTSNGAIAYLVFNVPNASGTYPINLSYVDGDILDGNIDPVDAKVIGGSIMVGISDSVTVSVQGKTATLTNNTKYAGKIFIAYYDINGNFLSLEQHQPSELITITNPNSAASRLKVMWWENTTFVKPLCGAEEIKLK